MTLQAISVALAGRFAGLTATNGGVVEGLASPPTSRLPNIVAATPVILVFHPIGVLDVGVSRIRRDEHDFPVRMLRDPVDYPTRSDWVYAWFDAMRDVVRDGDNLGLTYVSWARVIASRPAVDGHTYAKTLFDVVELTVRVHVGDIQP